MQNIIDRIKKNNNFDQLPGRDTPLIAGYLLDLSELPVLKHFFVSTETIHHFGDTLVEHIYMLRDMKTDKRIALHIIVAQKKFADAHEALFQAYSLWQHEPRFYLGQEYNIDIGNFCLLPNPSRNVKMIDFVRNNIAIKIRSREKREFPVTELATQMDELLKSEAVFSNLSESGKSPIINEFSTEDSSLEKGQRSNLRISAIDPDRGKLVYRLYPDSGSINLDKASSVRYYRAGNETGPVKIVLYAINQRNLIAVSETSIEIC